MEEKTIKKDLKFNIAKYISFAALFLIMQNAKLFGFFNPFPFALLFALVWCNQNVVWVGATFFLTSLVQGFSWQVLLPSLTTVFLLILFALIKKLTKHKMNVFYLCLYAILSQCGRFILVPTKMHYILNLFEVFVGVVVMLCFVCFFQALLKRKVKVKFNIDEIFCACIFVLAISCGFSNFKIQSINIGFGVLVFLMLLFCEIFNFSNGLIFASVMGVGCFLATGNTVLLSSLIILALVCGIFISTNTYFSAFSVMLIDLVLGFYFQIYPNYSWFSFLVIAFGCLCFLCVSSKTKTMLKNVFVGTGTNQGVKCLADVKSAMQVSKLNEISKIFEEMDLAYKKMLKKTLSKDEASFMLCEELQNRLCEDCPNKKICFRKSGEDMLNCFFEMFEKGLVKKQIGLIDVPNGINVKCDKGKVVLSTANTLLKQYLQYNEMLDGINTSRLLISDQMGSVSKVIKKLANESKKPLNFNHELEKTVLQNLVYENLTSVVDVVVAESEDYLICVVSSLKEFDDQKQLEFLLSKCCKIKMEVKEVLFEEETKLSSYYLVSSPKCDLVFGFANARQNENLQCGDSHSLVKLDTGKFLLGICDGMGSGNSANEISNQTMNLIENFYKAGFESDSIVSNVNKLFMAGNEEKFSTLDVCVLDLNNLQADFLKLGASNTFIKKQNKTEIIKSGALPIGVLEEMRPKLEKRIIEPKDIIFMISDGVSDCFETDDDLAQCISSLTGTNPQELANKLLQSAIDNNEGIIKDDMTVCVSRVFNKV